ncbi:lytic transglycosylase domain-containing protein [Solitalea sp. MAHUQ-68]|uniref:Lytic transglycosylase domain-containing protein n=1 Tax=Solitalea agri TaxID=2953739 RepID=A0A9X2F2V6_9SPHI|nr:lytic transglycosylase domain-containing protein [Solitalea agri]MCO4293164.1 lytic transglycosylase domain-containing protein [Solitalea agri]
MKKHFSLCALLIAFSGTLFAAGEKPGKVDDPNSSALMKPSEYKTSQSYLTSALTFSGEAVPFDNDDVYQKFLTNLNKRISSSFIENLQTISLSWFPVIEPILAKYGIPEDFKFIPAIESGFVKNARSVSGAVGYWQFMPATARAYGLRVSKKVDDRKNLEKSTIAACRYLNDLYERLGSWTLVAAAYNVGHNALESAMDRQNEDGYFDLKLNKETGNYVYKVLVFKHILENAADFDPYFNSSVVRYANLQDISSIGLLTLGALSGMGAQSNSASGSKVPKPAVNPITPKQLGSKKKLIAKAGKVFNWL